MLLASVARLNLVLGVGQDLVGGLGSGEGVAAVVPVFDAGAEWLNSALTGEQL